MIKKLGIDENGLGPIMGPLIITGVETETKNNQNKSTQYNIKDSKEIFKRKQEDFKTIEKIFLRYFKMDFKTVQDVFSKSILKDEIERICPIGPDKICFSDKVALPVWIKEENENSSQKEIDLAQLGLCPDEIKRALFIIVCPNLLSKYIEKLGSKFSANSFFMVRLGLKSSAEEVICGKSGYKKSYEREISLAIRDEGDKLLSLKIVRESEEESVYEILNNDETIKMFRFVKDADRKFPEVALASIIGKYIREISMLSITKFIEPSSQKPISGYGRKNTFEEISSKIIEKSKEEFSKEIPKICIIRER